jgi:hypothetical protein
MKKVIMFSLLLGVMGNVFAAPTLIEASATGTTVKFATKLSEKLPTGYKVKIDLNNGKGLVAMTCSGLTCSLSSNALPKVDSPTYKIGIYDAKGVLQGALLNGTYINSFLVIASGYSKISNSGAVLPDTAKLGSGSNDWACTKDNKTGLTWEVKTDDGGLRDKDWYYSWYKPSGYNGDFAGYTDINVAFGAPNCSTKDNCNTDAFTNAVNTKGLCGKKDWRMPTKEELMKLVVCSDGKYETDGSCTDALSVVSTTTININSTYFPNTLDYGYWSSSTLANFSSYALSVDFGYGYSFDDEKDFNRFVRLVR